MKMEERIFRRKKKLFLIVLVFSISSVFLFLFLSFTVYGFVFSSKTNQDENYEGFLRYIRLSNSNELSTGVTKLPKDLNEEEFISYNIKDASILISNFGVDGYKCTGTCYCDEKRRSTTTMGKQGVTFLVAALSLTVAYKKAKELFKDDCVNKMSDTCMLVDIESSVEECAPQTCGVNLLDDDDDLHNRRDAYFCSGVCVVSTRAMKKGIMTYGDAFKICDESFMESYITHDQILQHLDYEKVTKESVDYEELKIAKEIFRKEYMSSICRVWGEERVEGEDGVMRPIPVCSGSNNGENPSIKCEKTFVEKKLFTPF